MKVVMLTGGREWTDRDKIRAVLGRIPNGPHRLLHGDAPGADTIGASVAKELGWEVRSFPINRKRAKSEGPARNQLMVDQGPDLVVAFPSPNSRGTWDAVRRARARKIPVEIAG
jgi:hypothetical protein